MKLHPTLFVVVSALGCTGATNNNSSPDTGTPSNTIDGMSVEMSEPFDVVWGPEAAASPVPGRTEAQGTAAKGRLYVFAGYLDAGGDHFTTESDAYDPKTNTWTRIADMPSPVTHGGVAFDGDDTIWVAGGFPGVGGSPASADVWTYRISDDSWSAGPPLPSRVGGGALVTYGRQLHFASGGRRDEFGGITEDLTVHWILDLDNPAGGWTESTPVPEPGNHLGACRVGDWIYVVGGQNLQNEDTGNLATVRAYSPELDVWKLVASMPIPLGHIAASVVEHNGRIVVVGGVTTAGQFSGQVLSYDPSVDVWTNLTDLPGQRKSPVVGIIGTTIVVTGGEGGGDETIRGTLTP